MDFASSLSPTFWELFNHSRLRPDFVLELFDERMTPLLLPSDDPRVAAIRMASAIQFLGRTEMSFRSVLASGQDSRITSTDWDITLLPIRAEERLAGLLAALGPPAGSSQLSQQGTESPDGPAAAYGRVWRDAIEADLRATQRLRAEEQRVQRATAIARFAADLQRSRDEQDLVTAVLQAIAVWYNIDPRAYCRDLGGRFVLRGTLPGVETRSVPRTLDASAVFQARAARVPRSIADHPGGSASAPPFLLVSAGSVEEWLITASGPADPALGEQVDPLLRAFGAALERVRQVEGARLRQLLWEAMSAWQDHSSAQALATALLALLCQQLEATHGRFVSGDAGETRIVPRPRTADAGPSPQDGFFDAQTLSIRMPLPNSRFALVELRRTDGDAFRVSQTAALLAARPLLGAWLAGGGGASPWSATFSPTEAPRILRFSEPTSSPFQP